jgi:cytochrome c oxidase subunit IV
MSSHIAPKSLYYAIFLALMVLTGATVGVTYVDLGPLNMLIAMGIAVVKAILVILYFMHVRWSDRLTQLTIVTAFAFFGVLVAFTLSDYLGRGVLGVAGR